MRKLNTQHIATHTPMMGSSWRAVAAYRSIVAAAPKWVGCSGLAIALNAPIQHLKAEHGSRTDALSRP